MYKKIMCVVLSSFLCMCVHGAADPQLAEFEKGYPLLAAIAANDLPRVKMLVQQGVDINGYGPWNDMTYFSYLTPLLKTIDDKNYKAMEILIQAGANLNLPAKKDTQLPFMRAIHWMNAEAVRMLIEAGADVGDIKKLILYLIDLFDRIKKGQEYFVKHEKEVFEILQILLDSKKFSPEDLNFGLEKLIENNLPFVANLFIHAGATLSNPTPEQQEFIQKAKERPQEIVKQSKKEALEMQKFFETTKEVELPKELIGIMSDFFVSPEEEKKEKEEQEEKAYQAREQAKAASTSSPEKKTIGQRVKDLFRRNK